MNTRRGLAASRRRKVFTCAHCGAFAAHHWHPLGYQLEEFDEYPEFRLAEVIPEPRQEDVWESAPPSPWGGPENDKWVVEGTWAQSVCAGCLRPTTWRLEAIVYPQSSPVDFPHEDMPTEVAELYNEARSLVNLSRRASAALARATMELLLREVDQQAPKNLRLDERILRIEGQVSSGLSDLLTFIRHVGNQSLHVSGVPDHAVVMVLDTQASESVEAIFEAINELVDELITKPARNLRLSAMVPEGVLESVARKREGRGPNPN